MGWEASVQILMSLLRTAGQSLGKVCNRVPIRRGVTGRTAGGVTVRQCDMLIGIEFGRIESACAIPYLRFSFHYHTGMAFSDSFADGVQVYDKALSLGTPVSTCSTKFHPYLFCRSHSGRGWLPRPCAQFLGTEAVAWMAASRSAWCPVGTTWIFNRSVLHSGLGQCP